MGVVAGSPLGRGGKHLSGEQEKEEEEETVRRRGKT